MFILESPWPILTIGLVAELLLVVALFRTGKGRLLWAMGGVGLLVLIGFLIEQNTITDTKRVRQTLDAVAEGLMANRAELVKACIVSGPDGDAAREKTDWAFQMAVFRVVSIRNLEVKFNSLTSPPTAEASFSVNVRGKVRGGDIADVGEVFRLVPMKVKLRKESGRWLVYGVPEVDLRE